MRLDLTQVPAPRLAARVIAEIQDRRFTTGDPSHRHYANGLMAIALPIVIAEIAAPVDDIERRAPAP